MSPTERYTLSLHDALPISFTMSQQAQNDFYKSEDEAAMDYAAAVNEEIRDLFAAGADVVQIDEPYMQARPERDRKSTRLNSSHVENSYAVFCLKKKISQP